MCHGGLQIPLAPESQGQLAALLRGEADSAQLLRANTTVSSSGGAAASPGIAALYPLVWLLRGDICSSRPLSKRDIASGGRSGGGTGGGGGQLDWAKQWVACNASLLPVPDEAAGPPDATSALQMRRLAGRPGAAGWADAGGGSGNSTASWWRLDCAPVDAGGRPLGQQEEAAAAECSAAFAGPRWAAAGCCV